MATDGVNQSTQTPDEQEQIGVNESTAREDKPGKMSTKFRETERPSSALTSADNDSLNRIGAGLEQFKKFEVQKRNEIDERINVFIPNNTNFKVLNIVLVGESGSGKSSTGNLILGEEKFKVSSGEDSCTSEISSQGFKIDGLQVQVIDTPGCFNTNFTSHDRASEVLEHAKTLHGDVIFVLVQNLGQRRTSKEAKEQFLVIKKNLLQSEIHQWILLYTHGKSLFDMKDLKEKTLDGYLRCMLSIDDSQEQREKELKEIYEVISNRVVAIENGDIDCISPYERNKMRDSLLSYFRSVLSSKVNYVGPSETWIGRIRKLCHVQ